MMMKTSRMDRWKINGDEDDDGRKKACIASLKPSAQGPRRNHMTIMITTTMTTTTTKKDPTQRNRTTSQRLRPEMTRMLIALLTFLGQLGCFRAPFCFCGAWSWIPITPTTTTTTTTTTTRPRPTVLKQRKGTLDCSLALPAASQSTTRTSFQLGMAFYNDFDQDKAFNDDEDEDDNDDDVDDDDDEDDFYDDQAVADFRSKMSNLYEDEPGTGGSSSSGSFTTLSSNSFSAVDELIQFARQQQQTTADPKNKNPDWAVPTTRLEPGTVLVANPAQFCDNFPWPILDNEKQKDSETNNKNKKNNNNKNTNRLGGFPFASTASNRPNPRLLQKFGLTLPPPADLGADRRADLLPVVILVQHDEPSSSFLGVLLNRRTGYLLGDLEQPILMGGSSTNTDDETSSSSSSSPQMAPLLEKFCIQPLWFGGVHNPPRPPTSSSSSSSSGAASGLDMLHLCPHVPGAQLLTDDGLYWGGDPVQAQECLSSSSSSSSSTDSPIYTGFDFKFFVQVTKWFPHELEQELSWSTTLSNDKESRDTSSPPPPIMLSPAAAWFPCKVSKHVLFKSRDRMGGGTRGRRALPLWTEIMQLLGGDYTTIVQELYQDG